MSADDDRDLASSGDPVPAPADPVTDPVLLEVRAALAAARTLPLAEQPPALEAAHAALAARLSDVQNA